MGRPKAAESADTRARILAAATSAFAQVGYDAKLANIAEVAGVRRPSLLYHFESKHDLYCAVVRETFEALGQAINAPLAEESPFSVRLDAVVEGFETFFRERPEAAKLILREVLDARGPGHELLLSLGLPLLDAVEQFAAQEGGGHLRSNLPLRSGLMTLVGAILLRGAADPQMIGSFFGDGTVTGVFRATFLEDRE